MEAKVSKLFKYKSLPKYEGLEGSIRIKHKDVFVGVELEVENCPDIYKTTVIRGTEDHSLKINGYEFVTMPIKLRFLEVELRRTLEQLQGKVLLSSRCSTHVHMNVRDMTPTQLTNMVMLYMIFERSLYRMSGVRWNNNFCVPLYMAHTMARKWFENANKSPYSWSWYKYTGLNLSPIWGGESTKIGTVEFRQLHGSVDVEEIVQWCNIITSLKRAAQEMDQEEIVTHIRTMKTTSGYWWLAKEVFGSYAKLLTKQPKFAEDTENCISNLKYLLLTSLLKPKTVAKKPKDVEEAFADFYKSSTTTFIGGDSLGKSETVIPMEDISSTAVDLVPPKQLIKPIEVLQGVS